MDKIIIKGLNIFAYHGVNLSEKQNGQTFIVDAIIHINLNKPCLTDNLDDTLSYSAATKTIINAVTSNSYDLLEKVAECVANKLLQTYHAIKQVDITIKKPFAPINATFDYMAVEISRKSHEFKTIKTS